MPRWIGVVLGVVLLWHAPVWGQERPACFAQRQKVNVAGNMADMTVGATAVTVVVQDNSRCQVWLKNNGSNPMRCAPVAQGPPTASNGLLMNAGDQYIMTTAGREAWACIRSSGSNTTATTVEELP
jgi:hypothetical protein